LSALVCAQDFRPDVVLLDFSLPGMDGYDVARQLRGMPNQANTLLIAQSGYGQEEHLPDSETPDPRWLKIVANSK
jgi:two-component system CheB/CheR fusion protein